MSVKRLPLRAPAARLAPRRRTPLERIVGALEFATIARAIARVTPASRRRRRSLHQRPRLVALVGGGLAAVAAGAVLARRRRSVVGPPATSAGPGAFAVTSDGDAPSPLATTAPVAPEAHPEAAKLDVDAPNAGATGSEPPPSGS
jgi:hypothetical protein